MWVNWLCTIFLSFITMLVFFREKHINRLCWRSLQHEGIFFQGSFDDINDYLLIFVSKRKRNVFRLIIYICFDILFHLLHLCVNKIRELSTNRFVLYILSSVYVFYLWSLCPLMFYLLCLVLMWQPIYETKDLFEDWERKFDFLR